MFPHPHSAFKQSDRGLVQDKEAMFPLQEEALVYGACAPDAEDLSKLYVFGHWSMQVVCFVSAKFGPLMIFLKRWFAYNKTTQGGEHEYQEEVIA